MRGADSYNEALFTTVKLEDFVPVNHPLRPIRQWVNEALAKMDVKFSAMYEADIRGGRPSIAPEKLMRGIRPAKSSCRSETPQGCSCPLNFIADTWTLQELSYRAGEHGGGMRRSSGIRLCRHAGNPACRSQPLHWPTA